MPNNQNSNMEPQEILKNVIAEAVGALDAAAKEAAEIHESVAKALDAQDSLAEFRSMFYIPKKEDGDKEDMLYFCGNSLGLQPRATSVYVNEELEKWQKMGVEGHFNGKRPWLTIDDEVTLKSEAIVGAKHGEVAIMNSLTTNLHLLMVPFYRPTKQRHKIIIERQPFPSDLYAMQSQIRMHGFDEQHSLIQVGPRDGEHHLRTEDILACIDEHGDELALVMWPGVQYYTGQFFEIEPIVKKTHEKGALIGLDLAHAVGNVVLRLHDWQVDFAAWCSYKYLNSGPGSIGGAFVHERHADAHADRPRFAGWWGHDLDTRFDMRQPFSPIPGAYGYRLSNPPVLQTVALLASLDVFEKAGGITVLRRKSEMLTAYLELLLKPIVDAGELTIMTPAERQQRGCQLSLLFHSNVKAVHKEMERQGIIVDYREPSCIRVAPTPLYNTFEDVRRFVKILRAALEVAKKE